METSRRDFLKVATLGARRLPSLVLTSGLATRSSVNQKIARATKTRSTCPYCSVSCGVIIYTLGDKAKNVTPQVIHVEGDPDHPINRGTLCPKGASLERDILNERRLLKPQVRSASWLERIRVKKFREEEEEKRRTALQARRKPEENLS